MYISISISLQHISISIFIYYFLVHSNSIDGKKVKLKSKTTMKSECSDRRMTHGESGRVNDKHYNAHLEYNL